MDGGWVEGIAERFLEFLLEGRGGIMSHRLSPRAGVHGALWVETGSGLEEFQEGGGYGKV